MIHVVPVLALFASALVSTVYAGSTADLPLRYQGQQHIQLHSPQVIQQGTVLFRKETAYQPPAPEETVEAMVERMTSAAIAAAEARFEEQTTTQLNQARQNLAQNFNQQLAALNSKTTAQLASERSQRAKELSVLRQETDAKLARLETSTRDYIAQMTQENSQRLAKNLREYADSEVLLLQQQLAERIESAARMSALTAEEIRQQTADKLGVLTQQTEQNIMAVTNAKAREVEDRLVAFATNKAITEAERVKLTETDVAAIAANTLSNAGDEIKAISLQALAESDNYIKTIAREAITSEDPAMQLALNTAARKVITDGNEGVTFAIRQAVTDTLDELEIQSTNNQANTPTIVTGEEIIATGLKIGELQPIAGADVITTNLNGDTQLSQTRHRHDWVDIRQYQVVLHEDNKTIEQLMNIALQRAEPFAGPWAVKWRISDKNEDLLLEKFSLDVEASFEDFIAYLAQYMVNYRGVQLTFSLFDTERVIVISD